MTPLFIRLALAYFISPDPKSLFASAEWESNAAKTERQRMVSLGLLKPQVGQNGPPWEPTPALADYVAALRMVYPLPN